MSGAPSGAPILAALYGLVAQAMAGSSARPAILGLCGAQGSGKSTVSEALAQCCRDEGIATAVLSLDDLYLTRAEREHLGRTIHAMLATRGPPGTHDIGLGLEVIAALGRGEAIALPRFDKSRDDRADPASWPIAGPGLDLLIFEGWCVGAIPQTSAQLADPVNALEANDDPDGIWRNYCNEALAGPYQQLFARIDRLALLAAPDFSVVRAWRMQQEHALAQQAEKGSHVMDDAAIARFIAYYERLTRHILAEMPQRADVTVRLDECRRPIEIKSQDG